MRQFLPLKNIFKAKSPIYRHVPLSCSDRGRILFCFGGGMQGVGVNYANAFSDTNLDGDSTRKKLAEGGIWRVWWWQGPSSPSSPLLALYLEAGAYLICRLFFKEVSGLT